MRTHLELLEWQRIDPSSMRQLAGLSFDGDPAARRLAAELSTHQWVSILELRQGIQIQTSSFVGNLRLGELNLNIKPKIGFDVLAVLFRYAYGWHDLHLLPTAKQETAAATFQDLFIHQLTAEADHLVARGVFRQYRQHDNYLASPRGRLNLHQLVADGGVRAAEIACTHHERSADNMLNQALLAGLLFAAGQTDNLLLRTRLRRLASMLDMVVTRRRLTHDLLEDALRSLSRLNLAYKPALQLIGMLYEGSGVVFAGDHVSKIPLPGFLFDMNRFFEQLLTRFLAENLVGYTVKDQHRLTEMMTYRQGSNPRGRRSPTPRPDIAILRDGKLVGLFDAKYKDLWENPLPRDMLYQLAVYALSQPAQRVATILYPTTDIAAKDQIVNIHEPVARSVQGQVVLRPIQLAALAGTIGQSGVAGGRARRNLAHRMVEASGVR
jgi:5-methylcytosine-specific restriction enzyme subunit McrC